MTSFLFHELITGCDISMTCFELWACLVGSFFVQFLWNLTPTSSHLLSIWQYYNFLHSHFGNLEICGNFAERHSFRIVSLDSSETARKLCLSTKLQHLKIRWNYGIFRGGYCPILADVFRNPKVSSKWPFLTLSTPLKATKTFSNSSQANEVDMDG